MSLSALLLLAAVVSSSPASPEEGDPAVAGETCPPEVLIYHASDPVRICLNRFNTEPDSCIEVIIGGEVLGGVSLHFTRPDTGGWQYAGIIQPDSAVPATGLRMELITGRNGNLRQALFYPENSDTLQQRLPVMRLESDRLVEPDTLSTTSLHLQRTVHPCRPPEKAARVVNRTYTYPPNYRRDPIYNHPELSMFHCGKSVRMPTKESLENRAQQYVYWHCNVLAPLQFDNPDELEKREAVKNRFKKARPPEPVKKKKKTFLRLRPLH